MKIEELVGKKITNIFSILNIEVGGLDSGECFIELDNSMIIDLPNNNQTEVTFKSLDTSAKSIFTDLSDIPVYHVNVNRRTISETAEANQKEKSSFFGRIKIMLGLGTLKKTYAPYKIDYRENTLKYILNQAIKNILWYPDSSEKGFLLLENGYIITETIIANHGMGLVGINIYESIDALKKAKGDDLMSLYSIDTL
jgi:hypothetical protein